jgi:tRNA(Ile)-lysidine synthase
MDEDGNSSLVLEQIVKTVQTLTDAKRLWVGYSGGLDSHVLLDLMVKAFADYPDYQVGAVHVHHGISEHADDWVQHCEQICSELQVPLTVLWVDGRVVEGRSPEEVAREARFSALEKFLQQDECLLLAHHEADQAETILLRLFRGAGPQGLSGMPIKAALGESELIRPLLTVSKEILLNYAQEQALRWIEDDSNTNIRLDRNFLRHEILPKLAARWPRVVRSVSRAGSLCLETATAVQILASHDIEGVKGKQEDTLSVSQLLQLEPIRRRSVVRCWLQSQGYSFPSRDHMERIDREVLQAKAGAKPKLKISDYEVRRVRDELCVAPL